MGSTLRVSVGQHSLAGAHAINQDSHGAQLPDGYARLSKGIALALADGISSSAVSQLASATAIRSFLDDYFATSEAWSTRHCAECVLNATNAWLHAQTMRGEGHFDKDRGYVCTFSALILKGRELHLLHVGDSRIYRLHRQALEQLTTDHRTRFGPDESYLARALGSGPHVEIDYRCWTAEVGEIYVLATDGAYADLDAAGIWHALAAHGDDLDAAAAALVAQARTRGSDDDATLQLLRIDALPDDATPAARLHRDLCPPPPLTPGREFDGFAVIRALQVSARSHLHLVLDRDSGRQVVLKTPSMELRNQPEYLDGFVLEEWVARCVDSPHVVKAWAGECPRHYLYVALEYIEGQTLAQWMTDHPLPPLETVRGIVAQLAAGLQALHHREMVHRDLRPENVMIDAQGTVKLIDLANVQVAGLLEGLAQPRQENPPGTLQYLAPECLLGEAATPRSDLFALAAMVYQMLGGRLPYGLQAARVRRREDLLRLQYRPLCHLRPELPAWLDAVLAKALHPEPQKRQQVLSEFIFDLTTPGDRFRPARFTPLIESDPVLFWKCLSAVFFLLTMALLFVLHGRN